MSILFSVQSGKTLPYAAQRIGTALPGLIQTNNIYCPYLIYAGQKFYAPMDKNFQLINGGVPLCPLTGINCTTADGNVSQVPNPMVRESVEKIIGKKGTMQDSVLKFTFPRYDLKACIGPVSIEPELALTSWMAFHQMNRQSTVMGDLVLLESEIDPVISQLNANGIGITALHNHLLGELPRIMFLHILGIGDAVKLAQGLKNVLSVTQTPLTAHTVSPALPQGY